MRIQLDTRGMQHESQISGQDNEDTRLLQDSGHEARSYLNQLGWCERVEHMWLAFGVGGVVAVFACQITPGSPEADDWVWVVVGDLPPAYIDASTNTTARAALEGYIAEMARWVDAVNHHKSVLDLIPVNVDPTVENAAVLASRLRFIQDNLLAKWQQRP